MLGTFVGALTKSPLNFLLGASEFFTGRLLGDLLRSATGRQLEILLGVYSDWGDAGVVTKDPLLGDYWEPS